MANKLLRNLAITLGGGLAFGVGMKLGQSTIGKEKSGPGVDLEPLTERLKGFEDRVKKLEITGVSNGPGVLRAESFDQAILDQSLTAVEDRLALQCHERACLRGTTGGLGCGVRQTTGTARARQDPG